MSNRLPPEQLTTIKGSKYGLARLLTDDEIRAQDRRDLLLALVIVVIFMILFIGATIGIASVIAAGMPACGTPAAAHSWLCKDAGR